MSPAGLLRSSAAAPASAVGIRWQLVEHGIAAAGIARIHGPIGLPMQSDTPQEITVSVMAQLLHARAPPLVVVVVTQQRPAPATPTRIASVAAQQPVCRHARAARRCEV